MSQKQKRVKILHTRPSAEFVWEHSCKQAHQDTLLPSPSPSLFFMVYAFWVMWCEQVFYPFVLDTSAKCIDREGLEDPVQELGKML